MPVESPQAQRDVELIRKLIDALNRADFGFLEQHVAPDVEVVLREGTVHGSHHLRAFLESQRSQFEIQFNAQDFFEGPEGKIVACLEVVRGQEGGDALRAWPANVFRVEGDRVVFFEGYPRQEDALRACEVDAQPPRAERAHAGGAAIDVRGLRREFEGGIVAVDGIDLEVQPGEIYAFLGPNGAGKTTTVRMLCTLLRPTDGSATVAGFDVVKEAHQVRQSIGVALQEAALDPLMTGRELIVLQATLHSIPAREAKEKAARLLDRVGLTQAGDRRVGTYSGGMRRRLDLAMSLVHEPKVLFLDEPTTGLDPQSRRAIWDEVRRLNDEGMTVFLTTQYLEEADMLADRVGIIANGRMAAEGTPTALKAQMGRSYLELSVGGNGKPAGEVVQRFGELVEAEEGHVRVSLDNGAASIPEIVRALDEAGLELESLRLVEPTLDDAFLATTGEHLEGDYAPEAAGA